MRELQLGLRATRYIGYAALVDDVDYASAVPYSWFVQRGTRTLYAVRHVRRADGSDSIQGLHTFITGLPYVDHRDHNGLNDQRYNLRDVSSARNQQNQLKRELYGGAATSSRYKGVSWNRKRCRWVAYITVDSVRRQLGAYGDEVEAACAYDTAAREAFGEFACTNFPAAL